MMKKFLCVFILCVRVTHAHCNILCLYIHAVDLNMLRDV
jgi:hypothetical protein